ncbi:unnamed protein product, partial [Mesorhabditis spiculigera]
MAFIHAKCRNTDAPYLHSQIHRVKVPDAKVKWSTDFSEYSPPDYTDPKTFGKPYADDKLDGIKWNAVDGKINRKSHVVDYSFDDEGRPLNPMGRTGLRGRGVLGRWGPNHAADPIVTRNKDGRLYFVAIQRSDTGEWAIPGGMVDAGENVSATLKREFSEEALGGKKTDELKELWTRGKELYKGYVDDPRNTDNSWMETVCVHFHDDAGLLKDVDLEAADDATAVRWIDVFTDEPLYASHEQLIKMVPWGAVARDSIQKKDNEAKFSAVIVADNFEHRFDALFREGGTWCQQAVCNVPIIEITLEWLLRANLPKVILLVAERNYNHLKPVEEKWRIHFEQFLIVSCKDALSVGDTLRELDSRALVTSDFLLIDNPATFTNSTLKPQLQAFQERRNADKHNVMTLIYAKADDPQKSVIGVKKGTQKLAYFHSADHPSRVTVEKNLFTEEVVIRRDLVDTGIAFCSVNILVQEILVNEEILLLNIHIDVLSANEGAVQIYDYDSYVYASKLLLNHWLYPLSPENLFQSRDYAMQSNVADIYYAQDCIRYGSLKALRVDVLGTSSLLGKEGTYETAVKVVNSVIGNGTTIGLATRITDSIVGKNCKIGKGCLLESTFIGDNVTIPDNCRLEKQILSHNLIYPSTSDELNFIGQLLSPLPPDEDSEDGIKCVKIQDNVYLWKLTSGFSVWSRALRNNALFSVNGGGSNSDDLEEEDEDEDDLGEVDPVSIFQEEIFDSMNRIIELGFNDQTVRNLTLEINSSKLANNISMDDLSKYLFKSILQLDPCQTIPGFKALALQWKNLYTNYYRPQRCQIQLLMGLEEHYHAHDGFGPKLPLIVHFMYDEDKGLGVLDDTSILEWHNTLDGDSPLRPLMKQLVDWLEESDDEDDSD